MLVGKRGCGHEGQQHKAALWMNIFSTVCFSFVYVECMHVYGVCMHVCIFTCVFRQKVEVRCLFYFYFQAFFLISFHLIYLGRNSCLNLELSNFTNPASQLVLRVLSQPPKH